VKDIVERLRHNAPGARGLISGDLMREAADEIERLRKEWAEVCRDYDDALAAVKELYESSNPFLAGKMMRRFRAVIAKAEGKQ
jgi:hypothetical protein